MLEFECGRSSVCDGTLCRAGGCNSFGPQGDALRSLWIEPCEPIAQNRDNGDNGGARPDPFAAAQSRQPAEPVVKRKVNGSPAGCGVDGAVMDGTTKICTKFADFSLDWGNLFCEMMQQVFEDRVGGQWVFVGDETKRVLGSRGALTAPGCPLSHPLSGAISSVVAELGDSVVAELFFN